MEVKTLKIVLDTYGSFLGREKGCLVVRDKQRKETRYPLFENDIGEVIIKSGNMVSSGFLSTCGFWRIDVLILTKRGHPVAILKSLDDDSHVWTRVAQYRTLENDKGREIAKQFVLSKIEGHNQVLKKYGLRHLGYSVIEAIKNLTEENFSKFRRKLNGLEGKCSRKYFNQVFSLLPECVRPKGRKTFKAFDGVNNTFNLGYELLRWKVHIALIKAKLEPYLGFLHSMQFGKPSLICDFQELYRYLVDDFVIQFSLKLKPTDFVLKDEYYSLTKKGKRQYLNDKKNREFLKKMNKYFLTIVDVPRIKVGKKQEIETLINEEALLFAKFLREEKTHWEPRIAELR